MKKGFCHPSDELVAIGRAVDGGVRVKGLGLMGRLFEEEGVQETNFLLHSIFESRKKKKGRKRKP